MAEARERLTAARVNLDSGFLRVAVSTAYYAMLYAARAALSEEERYAKTHSGTWELFRETFVATGRFDQQLFREARESQELREKADYDAVAMPVERAREIVDLADRFVAAIAALV
jgi:uncharacterized protein (UPF0332 family)